MKISSRVAEQVKIYNLRKLGSFPEMLWIKKQVNQLASQNKNFYKRTTKCKKSTLKSVTGKSFSRKFKNLSRIFCPELSEETLVYF